MGPIKRIVVGAAIVIGTLVVVGWVIGLTTRANPSVSTDTVNVVGSNGQVIRSVQVPASTPTTVTEPQYPNGEPGDKDFAVASLQAQDDGFGNIGGSIRITNVSNQTLTTSFTVTFFRTAAETGTPLGSALGNADDVEAGQTVTEDLISTDPMFSGNFYYQFQVNYEIPG